MGNEAFTICVSADPALPEGVFNRLRLQAGEWGFRLEDASELPIEKADGFLLITSTRDQQDEAEAYKLIAVARAWGLPVLDAILRYDGGLEKRLLKIIGQRFLALAENKKRPQATPSFDIFIQPGNATAGQIADFLEALSDLHRAYGGNGLDFSSGGGTFVLQEAKVDV